MSCLPSILSYGVNHTLLFIYHLSNRSYVVLFDRLRVFGGKANSSSNLVCSKEKRGTNLFAAHICLVANLSKLVEQLPYTGCPVYTCPGSLHTLQLQVHVTYPGETDRTAWTGHHGVRGRFFLYFFWIRRGRFIIVHWWWPWSWLGLHSVRIDLYL
jgi:hypothetical protein